MHGAGVMYVWASKQLAIGRLAQQLASHYCLVLSLPLSGKGLLSLGGVPVMAQPLTCCLAAPAFLHAADLIADHLEQGLCAEEEATDESDESDEDTPLAKRIAATKKPVARQASAKKVC